MYLMACSQNILQQLEEIGQLQRIYSHPSFSKNRLDEIVNTLVPVHQFYEEMGGIVGYHRKILSLMGKKEKLSQASFHSPSFIDITESNEKTLEAIEWGIEALPFMAEMIPLGGAADRLHLQDEHTGSELPAAKLIFAGKTLLQRMVEDIQARERLYFQKFGKKILTPIAMMTSYEKKNHTHIEEMLESNHWFGRPKDSIRTFAQPLVPVVNDQGEWLFTDELKLVMKPGGHGVIWKLAIQSGIFSWFQSFGKTKLLVRQINNPIAGLDYGLLAFMGIGVKKNKKFGFASCPRLLKAAEGVNVVVEKENSVVLTNVEYCDFDQFGIEDAPLKEGEPYSRFSSNTNILFGDLSAISDAVSQCPYPGLILNLKNGSFGRLESTMQNLADVFEEQKKEDLQIDCTFITYNHRHKTISTTKKAFIPGGNPTETPERCFYDFLYAARELLGQCRVSFPEHRSFLDYLSKGPEFVFLYHPFLGPLYSTIQQKINGGTIAIGSELNIEIADLSLHNFSLAGSLQLKGLQGKCVLNQIKIENEGVDWQKSTPFWKGKYTRKQSLEIELKGDSQFIAEQVTFYGSHRFIVEEGCFMRVSQKGEELMIERGILNG
jgi:UTP---glucose-1-phosphate uridylyltransferase